MTTQQDREELIRWIEQESLDHEYGSYAQEMLRKAAALLAEDGMAGGEVVYLVATGETYEGQELYTRHDVCPPLCEAEKLYTHSQPAQVAQPLTDEQRLACASNIADSILFDLQGRKQLLDGVDEQVLQEIVAEHTSIILNGLAAHGIGKDQP